MNLYNLFVYSRDPVKRAENSLYEISESAQVQNDPTVIFAKANEV
ncbi:hypothetical protein ACQKGD_27650 [Peribacillus frigoritolerans]